MLRNKITEFLVKLHQNEKGQGTIEYALIVVAVVTIIGLTLVAADEANPLRAAITAAFEKITDAINPPA